MKPDDFNNEAARLCQLCLLFGQRGWCRATSGNFSARVDDKHCLITQSGREKSTLTIDDLMICDLDGNPVDDACRPSAETPLHTLLYRLDSCIGSVLHTHSTASTVLSRSANDAVLISGFEMQKAIAGVRSHNESLQIPIFENDQDMQALAELVHDAWNDDRLKAHGFLIRGHGLYAWGRDLDEAKRHIEGLEFLFECLWQERVAGRS